MAWTGWSASTSSTPGRDRNRSTWAGASRAANPEKDAANVAVGRAPTSAATASGSCPAARLTTYPVLLPWAPAVVVPVVVLTAGIGGGVGPFEGTHVAAARALSTDITDAIRTP